MRRGLSSNRTAGHVKGQTDQAGKGQRPVRRGPFRRSEKAGFGAPLSDGGHLSDGREPNEVPSDLHCSVRGDGMGG
ncbi:hypothetical protein J2S55_007223 [Streptosporangium brasiliense]|uniref:Uncharacterized protein n=1 Tax=Streptosporangium brasiliense TaxID=47480 RepID=A0ABT9RF92_9ACTN|nr:hypothetical protein [Streptosporangium brasiliense]